MGRGRRDKVHLTVAQRENFEQISGGGFITEYANQIGRASCRERV